MRYLFGIICVCSLGVLPILGCSETTGEGGAGGDAGTGGSAGMGGSGGTAGTGGATVQYRLRLTVTEPDGSLANVQDVEVCEADTENCSMSDDLGVASIVVPADQEILFTIEKEGYGKWLTADVSDETRERVVVNRRMHTNAQLEAVAGQLGIEYPWMGGIVGLVRFPTVAQGGLTFTPVGSTADQVGDEFYYDGALEEYSVDLQATSAFDGVGYVLPLGDGGFAEITPGEQQFEYGGTAGDCAVSWAWPGDTANTIRLPVREGYRTYGSMSSCTAP